MKQMDIVLLPYPFSDLSNTKIRPALIISNDNINKISQDCIMVPLTTVLKNEPYSINITQVDFENGQLIKPSRIKVDKIIAVKQSLIIKKIGTLSSNKFNEVKEKLNSLF
jgi:mRNA interferase MazF